MGQYKKKKNISIKTKQIIQTYVDDSSVKEHLKQNI